MLNLSHSLVIGPFIRQTILSTATTAPTAVAMNMHKRLYVSDMLELGLTAVVEYQASSRLSTNLAANMPT